VIGALEQRIASVGAMRQGRDDPGVSPGLELPLACVVNQIHAAGFAAACVLLGVRHIGAKESRVPRAQLVARAADAKPERS